MIPPDVRLYSWLDVEDALLRQLETQTSWPEWLLDAHVYWDGLSVRVRPGKSALAESWLTDALEPRIRISEYQGREEMAVLLETSDGDRLLPVQLEESETEALRTSPGPTLLRPSLIQAGLTELSKPSPFLEATPPMIGFHSFKGGVGRTLHALALAFTLADEHASVLLVDADFEAPGITWLLESRLPTPPVSLADFLALVHGDPEDAAPSSIDLVANRIQDALLDNVFVLPAFRSARSFQSLDIRPEHLTQGRPDPFVLSNILAALGRRLNVDAVIIDLRAGLSELAAGLLLDPRIQRVFVTTMSGQSLNGTEVVMDLISKRAPSISETDPLPTILINEVPGELRDTKVLAAVEERMLLAVSRTIVKDFEPTPNDLIRGPSWFDPTLITLSPNWDEVRLLLSRSQVREAIRSIANSIPKRSETSSTLNVGKSDVGQARKSLAATARRFIFAETGPSDDFLPISPLRRLAEDHRNQIPNAVVVGAKGAGKTYTFLQLMGRPGWLSFAVAAGASRPTVDALLFPLLQPKNVTAEALQKARERVSEALGLSSVLNPFEALDLVQSWVRENLHEGQWRDRWLDLMAWSIGFQVNEPGAGRALSEFLRSAPHRVLFVVDGLEDLFQDISSSELEQRAVRALIQDVPNWLEQVPERKLGMLVFVRRDIVTAAVRQNSAQLMARYEPYALKWDRDEALRLALWIAVRANILPNVRTEKIRDLSQEELVEQLIPLWGRKLGLDKSREGRSAEWVIAALSDFRGQIQARDVVRCLYISAQGSTGNSQWADRILVPSAIRDAVAECSVEKIKEIEQENQAVGRIFEKLRALDQQTRTIPFRAEEVHLDSQELLLLELNGVVVADGGAYYMPEIFRRGLDFRLPLGARPKVLALSRRRGL